jgi:hypothetical protein
MANTIIWNARPTAEVVMAANAVAPAGLRDADNAEELIAAADVANGTGLYTYADFLLYLHDFDAAPTAGGYFELHIIYEFDAIYGDGEDGDVSGNPGLSGNTLCGVFPVTASDEDQFIQLCRVPIGPHDFRIVLVNQCGQAIADTDGSYLAIFRYCDEVQ